MKDDKASRTLPPIEVTFTIPRLAYENGQVVCHRADHLRRPVLPGGRRTREQGQAMRVTGEGLKKMLETLESDCIDDPEDILDWFAENGPSIIRELLRYRTLDVSGEVTVGEMRERLK